jgi:hypothetical protein
MPMGYNDERRTNNDERIPMTDVLENLSYLTPTSVMESLDSISYVRHILTPLFAMHRYLQGPPECVDMRSEVAYSSAFKVDELHLSPLFSGASGRGAV